MIDKTISPTMLAAGAGALATLLAARASRAPARTPADIWVWPLPSVDGRAPTISNRFGTTRTNPDGTRTSHPGVDLMYKRRDGSDMSDAYPPGTSGGSPGHFMPAGIPVLAARDGVVWSAGLTPHGYAIVLDHGAPWATFYQHLERLLVPLAQRGVGQHRVRAGDIIGVVGASPLDAERLRHLHLEVWRGGGARAAIDPEPMMKQWSVLPWKLARRAEPPARRNGGLVYRRVGGRGEPYPSWLRDLDGASGVYVIREYDRGGTPTIVYVGESHTGRLYQTLTRHFQNWRRWKGYWKGQYGKGHDPGLTYKRERVDVAVRVLSPEEALDEEVRLIQKLEPRDNLLGQRKPDEDDAVPF